MLSAQPAAAGRPSYWRRTSSLAEPERSGDFAACFDIVPHRRAFVVGDIAGHRTALGEAKALCAVVSRLDVRGTPLAKILRLSSSAFAEAFTTDASPFASLFLAVADLRERTIEYASAGHEPALLFSGDDACAHEHLPPTGPLLGVEPRPSYRRRVLPLVADSLLVVVTDGITEARRRTGEELSFFGSAGVTRAVCGAVRAGRDPARAIYGAAVLHAGGALSDDASVVVSAFPAPRTLTLAQTLAFTPGAAV
jgi:sigma-B regulation protein RsbU (phosphoserine phosphatase)